jgi:hypothetical protein
VIKNIPRNKLKNFIDHGYGVDCGENDLYFQNYDPFFKKNAI